jgi:hypothetical protein
MVLHVGEGCRLRADLMCAWCPAWWLQVFMPDDISAALLTLVSAHPDVAVLMKQLLTTRQGVELYLRSPALFNLQKGDRVTFAEVGTAAGGRGNCRTWWLVKPSACRVICVTP